MFGHLIVSQNVSKLPQGDLYSISTSNVFDLPVKGSYFSFTALLILGDLDASITGHKLTFRLDNDSDPKKNRILINNQSIEPVSIPQNTASITMGINFNNQIIDEMGLYSVVALIDNNEIDSCKILFRLRRKD
ncbi:hypothetical protein [Oenococcus oeni]|uniref:hypothetical protein n=1 Tax=Oenococcus oeni TaxID=1247 RepID=UPI0010BA64FE|nr:hypothetical protein [Oenococcus oeni]SYW14256.1 hypothetical protein OENI_440005 [Oenococcus oeni]